MVLSWRTVWLAWLACVGAAATGADTFEQRAQAVIAYAAKARPNIGQHDGPHRAGRNGFWFAEARLAKGDVAGAMKILPGVLDDVDGRADAGGANGGFSLWPGMDCYLRWRDKLSADVDARFKQAYCGCETYGRGATPNQQIMDAVACRLACETWGEAAVTTRSGITFRQGTAGDKTGRQWLLREMANIPRYNFRERWSKHYLWATLGPLRTLADLSTDPELRQRAHMVWLWGVTNAASTWFAGHWALPAGRGSTGARQVDYDLTEFSWWLLFGGPKPRGMLDSEQSLLYAMPKAPSPLVPAPILAMVDKRPPAYTVRTLARLHETQFATSYMTPGYALFSEVEGDTTLRPDGTLAVTDLDNAGVPSNDWSAERWALVWDDAPDYGESSLTMRPPTSYGWAKGSGIAPYEDTLQAEGTLVGVLNIPADKLRYTLDRIPRACLASIDEAATTGRLFVHYKTVLVALYRTDKFTWATTRSDCAKRGFALETAAPSEYPQATPADRLKAFRDDVLTKGRVDASHLDDAQPRLVYTTRRGQVLDLTYGQAGKVDGVARDYEHWPLQEDPWVKQPQMGNLTLTSARGNLLLDFDHWKLSMTEQPKP